MTEDQLKQLSKGIVEGFAPYFREIYERLDRLDRGLAEVRDDIANLRSELAGVIDERFRTV
ncbi:MAG: hypothetical protein OXO56_07970 [Gammaproteobacteria bacterium]|nr:hypothetical protein [Gammaproteobacteria bacterium]